VRRLRQALQRAASLPPERLVGAVLRRGRRAVEERRYRRRARFCEQEILSAFGASDEAELIRRAFTKPVARTWCHLSSREEVRQLLTGHEDARTRALARADRCMARRFMVFECEVAFGPGEPVAWDVDPASGHRFEGEGRPPAGADPKYPWVLGRFDWAVALGQGYWAADREAEAGRRAGYAREFVSQAGDFLRTHPPAAGVQWTSPMEVALRAANLAQAIHLFADAPELSEPGFVTGALLALSEHSRFVEAHLEDAGAPNNHLVSGLVGLLAVAALFPQLPEAHRQGTRAARALRRQMRAQVHPDGMSFEGSVPYHRLAVELFTLAWVLAEPSGIRLGDAYRLRLQRMYSATAGYLTSGGLAPQIGDNDSGRAFPLADRPSLHHRYLLGLGAALFGEAGLKETGSTLPDEALWLVGTAGSRRFDAAGVVESRSSWHSAAAGLYLLRSGALEVAVSAGRQGQAGVGGHSHNDKLSFELHVGGVPVIVDPGTPTYTRDTALRNAYRSTAFHNTPEIDGEEQARIDPARLFALPEGAFAEVEQVSPRTLVVRHRGYRRLPTPVEVRRAFTLEAAAPVMTVSEILEGSGEHRVAWRIHFAPGEVELPEPGVATAQVEGAPKMRLLFPPALESSLEAYLYSPGYGETRAAQRLVLRRQSPLPLRVEFRFECTIPG